MQSRERIVRVWIVRDILDLRDKGKLPVGIEGGIPHDAPLSAFRVAFAPRHADALAVLQGDNGGGAIGRL